MSKEQIDKLPGEDSFYESLERVHQAERERLHRAFPSAWCPNCGCKMGGDTE